MPISFKNVSYTYGVKTPFEFEALKDANTVISNNCFTCIVGHTGCGKSTLIQQINGLLIPTSGDVEIDEFVISSDKKKCTKKITELRKNVGIVFQFSEYQLFDETVEDDVAFGPLNFGCSKAEAYKLAHEWLTKVGIPESYYKRSPFELSGGEKRRVALAGVMSIRPKYLILDEPTAGLDPQGSEEILSLFKELNNQGTTIILVTHDMNLVYHYAKNVIVMNEGKIVKNCKPSELFRDNVEQYSLEDPQLAKAIKLCLNAGLNIDLRNINDVQSLAKEIAKVRLNK